MASFSSRYLLHRNNRAPRSRRVLRSRNKHKRICRLRAKMPKIMKDLQNIKEGQKQVRKNLEAIEALCAQLTQADGRCTKNFDETLNNTLLLALMNFSIGCAEKDRDKKSEGLLPKFEGRDKRD
ncbi:hypothetical protein SLE2022_094050 [Rubroshorea leprosula]